MSLINYVPEGEVKHRVTRYLAPGLFDKGLRYLTRILFRVICQKIGQNFCFLTIILRSAEDFLK